MNIAPRTAIPDRSPGAWLRRVWRAGGRRGVAFTLLEMLTVIAVMGIIAALVAPSINNLAGGNVINTATRQLLDDLNQARLRAIAGRTTVYVLFFPKASQVVSGNLQRLTLPANLDQNFFTAVTPTNTLVNPQANDVLGWQLISYALYVKRGLGDQLGRDTQSYVTTWKTLPDGTFLEPANFTNSRVFFNVDDGTVANPKPYVQLFPFSTLVRGVNQTVDFYLPFIAFDSQGRLVGRNEDVRIPICQGSISAPRDLTTRRFFVRDADPRERPPKSVPAASGGILPGVMYYVTGVGTGPVNYNGQNYVPGDSFIGVQGTASWTGPNNMIVKTFEGVSINWLTGRSRIIRPELQ